MVAEENKSAWVDSDSEEPSFGTSSSSESEDEVQCLMADDTDEDVKAEIESCATKGKLVSSSDMQATLSKLETENEELKSRSRQMLYENQRLAGLISSWSRYSTFLYKLHGAMKPTGDKSGLGYDVNDSSTTETSSTPRLDRTKLQTMNFVKPSMGQSVEAQSVEENVRVDAQLANLWRVVTLVMSLFDLQDVRIAIGSLATLDLPMVVDLIGIYGLKGPYCTLTTTNWFLQALSVIPRGS
ncbi:spindle pole body component 110-like [Dorcoceras hygrometricum]|uniref:Spindle pole body component 110-like n=1 Tax=Dorcoceras hygrometricum TaxID=472368 RepID=A0A2Z7BJ50_9LAMI|nr:spindle pole body component 110-like [Dorcoceras hygrometricum]